jgi:hypothetical protein
MPEQTIDQHDLILISDAGEFFLVKMQDNGDGTHTPFRVDPLNLEFQALPKFLRDSGVELADIPDNVSAGGCSCYLLNLKRLSGV